jgi:hypothetical protein
MKSVHLFGILTAMIVAGCATQPTVPFSDSDLRGYAGGGSAAIAGHAVLNAGDGKVMSGGGYQVELTPATAYTKERFSIAQHGGSLPPPEPGLAQYVRTTTTDFMGNFVFRGIPPGEYLLSCVFTWEAESKFQANSNVMMTGQALASTTVAAGETAKVTLKGNDPW